MDELAADHAAFRSTVADLHAAAQRLRADRDHATRCVDGLLAGWRGVAAGAYADGWSEWRHGADRVLEALEAMARLLDAADADLVAVDGSSGSALTRLTARLG